MIKLRKMRLISVLSAICVAVIFVSTLSTISMQPTVAYAEPSQTDYQEKIKQREQLKKQLAGVNSKLADLVLRLSDLTEKKIPDAEKSLQDAQTEAQQAQSLVASTADRLQAAQLDKARLEEQIRQTGVNFDDAKEAVAQLARSSFHGSNTSQIVEVVTQSTTAQDFVNKLQTDAAIARTESNTANEAAIDLNMSANRHDRLVSIEQHIAALKQQADKQASQAQRAAAVAQAKQQELVRLREQEQDSRKQLESQKGNLNSKIAKEAAEIVAMKAAIDAYNLRLAKLKDKPNPHAAGRQQINNPKPSALQPVRPSAALPFPMSGKTSNVVPQGMNYSPFGNCYEAMTVCYGHPTGNIPTIRGNAYPWSECTWYAYHRRVDYYHLPTGSFMGNGGQWAATGSRLGYLVNHTPHVGAAIVFLPGQGGSDPFYGHVAVVERINADGSILISECGAVWRGVPHWRTIYNPGAYLYVHY